MITLDCAVNGEKRIYKTRLAPIVKEGLLSVLGFYFTFNICNIWRNATIRTRDAETANELYTSLRWATVRVNCAFIFDNLHISLQWATHIHLSYYTHPLWTIHTSRMSYTYPLWATHIPYELHTSLMKLHAPLMKYTFPIFFTFYNYLAIKHGLLIAGVLASAHVAEKFTCYELKMRPWLWQRPRGRWGAGWRGRRSSWRPPPSPSPLYQIAAINLLVSDTGYLPPCLKGFLSWNIINYRKIREITEQICQFILTMNFLT